MSYPPRNLKNPRIKLFQDMLVLFPVSSQEPSSGEILPKLARTVSADQTLAKTNSA
mgnify:CR=1 FL=1